MCIGRDDVPPGPLDFSEDDLIGLSLDPGDEMEAEMAASWRWLTAVFRLE